GHEAGRPRHDAPEHHHQGFPDPPESFPRPRAYPRRTEARTVGRRIRRSETMYKSKKPYHYGTGRRKSSVARVRLFPNGTGAITINGRDIDDYFGLETLKLIVRQPLDTTDTLG